MIKSDFKKSPDELQEYLQFKRRGYIVRAKRAKEATTASRNIEEVRRARYKAL